jgi:hypothetical protein
MAGRLGALLNISAAPGVRHAFLPVIISGPGHLPTGMARYPFGDGSRCAWHEMPVRRSMPVFSGN